MSGFLCFCCRSPPPSPMRLFQIMTRKLGAVAKASAMAVYVQAIFIVVSLGFFLAAGDGRYAEGSENDSIIVLFRAWTWPEGCRSLAVRRARPQFGDHRLCAVTGLSPCQCGHNFALRICWLAACIVLGLGALGRNSGCGQLCWHPAHLRQRSVRVPARAAPACRGRKRHPGAPPRLTKASHMSHGVFSSCPIASSVLRAH